MAPVASPSFMPTTKFNHATSWEIKQEPAPSVFYQNGAPQKIIVPYVASNRNYTIGIFERDCSTPTAIPSLLHYQTRSDEVGFIDVSVQLSITSMANLQNSSVWKDSADGGDDSFSFCLEYMTYLTEEHKIGVSVKKNIFNIAVKNTTTVKFGGRKQPRFSFLDEVPLIEHYSQDLFEN